MDRPPPPFADASASANIERIVCASLAASTHQIYAQLERIRKEAVPHNQATGLRSVLIYQSGWFVRWLEGPSPALRALVDNLKTDQHHHSMRLLHHSVGLRYLQEEWSMVLDPSTESTADFGRRVKAVRHQFEQGRQFSPTSVLRRLSTPLRLEQASSMANPERFHRIGACSASGSSAYDLVRWLGQQHGQTTVTRRVAGADGLDGGSDYVEFMEHDYPCRVIAVSRNGLQTGILRAFLPDWPQMLLLLNGNDQKQQDLMERMQRALDGAPCSPDLLGVAPDADAHARAAERSGKLNYIALPDATPDDLEAVWRQISAYVARVGPPPLSIWPLPDSRLDI